MAGLNSELRELRGQTLDLRFRFSIVSGGVALQLNESFPAMVKLTNEVARSAKYSLALRPVPAL